MELISGVKNLYKMGDEKMKEKILKALYGNKGNYISGEELAEKFGVSRTAIWKQINTLRNEGYSIETTNKKGYCLLDNDNKLVPIELISNVKTKTMGKNILCFDSIDSTNNYAKQIAYEAPHGTTIISDEQVGGRGRLGRGWNSPKGEGVWMSIIVKPNIPPTEGTKMTQIAAAAVCMGIRNTTGMEVFIKWPNDIILNGKKVCGILTEMTGELNQVAYIVVGIGINVNIEWFPEELKDKATSLLIESKEKLSRKQLIVSIINEFEKLYEDYIENGNLSNTVNICRKYSAMLGKRVRVIQGNKEDMATAIDITDEGVLMVKLDDGKEQLIMSGEVSIRGENGYI